LLLERFSQALITSSKNPLISQSLRHTKKSSNPKVLEAFEIEPEGDFLLF